MSHREPTVGHTGDRGALAAAACRKHDKTGDRGCSAATARAGWFTIALLLIAAVMDGWSGKPSPTLHQLFLLPVTVVFLVVLTRLLARSADFPGPTHALATGWALWWTPERALLLSAVFVFVNLAVLGYQRAHFASLGYAISARGAMLATVPFALFLVLLALRQKLAAWAVFASFMTAAAANFSVAILHFPLNYLRSDMLPVIGWADGNLLRGISPYTRIFVGARIYDFPYLPGMLVAYLPFAAMHLDLRWWTLICLLVTAAIAYAAARPARRLETAALLGLFLLNPFLQYRHELYLEPHWMLWMAAFALLAHRRFAAGAFAFGLSMALYQFSWIVLPFLLLHALRRSGWVQVLKELALAAAGMLLVMAPFLRSASRHISHNAVGQWGQMAHALAEPMNLSFWVTYVVPPAHLLQLQAGVMVLLFAYCFARGRCGTLADTLRWVIVALTVFIMLNVIVDGYFYLMLLVPMLAYVCIANRWWSSPETPVFATDPVEALAQA